MNKAKQRRKRRSWTLWLLLAASIPDFAAAQSSGLIRDLGLPPGDYWVASNGLAQPLSALSINSGQANEIFLLRREAGELSPVGWFEVTESTLPDSSVSARTLTVDGSAPQASARLSGSWLTSDLGTLLAAPRVRLLLSFDDPAGVRSWRLTDTHPVSIANGSWQPGVHELTVIARDLLGNEDRATNLTFEVDAEGPALDWAIESEALAEGAAGPVYQPPVALRVSADDAAGLAKLEIDQGAGWQNVATDSVLSVSTSSVKLRATDRLGNQSVRDAHWRYDLEAPVIRVFAQGAEVPDQEDVVLPVGGSIRIEVSDDGVGVESASYRYNRKPSKPLPPTIRFVDRGWYQVQLRASDRLGNERLRYVDVRTAPRGYRPKRAAESMGDGS